MWRYNDVDDVIISYRSRGVGKKTEHHHITYHQHFLEANKITHHNIFHIVARALSIPLVSLRLLSI